MQYQKLDPALQIALDSGPGPWEVVAHVAGEPDEEARQTLAELRAVAAAPVAGIYVATLTAEGIEQLSERDWVTGLQLARQLRPAE